MVAVETSLLAAGADAAVKAGATAATTALFKAATERVQRAVTGPSKSILVRALASLQGYSAFLQETHDRVSTFKTFADPTKPVSLLDHFVETKFEISRTKRLINHEALLGRLKRPSRIVISATAGYGKSMVMRYLALALFEQPTGKIPLFLELRNLNRVHSPSIINFLHSSYRRVGNVEVEAFRQGLTAGSFVLLLDGFDELNHELRPIIENEILEITREFPNCSIVVSGRPDERFKSWRSFSVMKVAPMEKSQVVELINKLDYERGVRKRFINKINAGLYESHQSFLSTPLLAILMLLTFEQNANIPDKMHLFYGEAFKTLFHKHDALKEQYDRSRKSGLAVDDFERVFSVFCLKTYVQERVEFSDREITASIKDALKYESLDVKSSDFLFDIEEAVCLMMKEGSSYFFVHRSFQEYFTSVFLANCAETIRDEFMDQVATRYWDNVLPMLFDMASAQIEPTWVTRKCKEYLDAVGDDVGKIPPIEARFQHLSFWRRDGEVHWNTFALGPFAKFISILARFYPSVSGHTVVDFKPLETWAAQNWNNLVSKYGDQTIGVSPVTFVAIPITEIPTKPLADSNFITLAENEYRQVGEVYKQLDKEQKSKNEFLDKLFASPRGI